MKHQFCCFEFAVTGFTPSAGAEWSSAHPRCKRKGTMRDKEIEVQDCTFHESGKRYPVKPSDTMLKTNRKKNCHSNLIKLWYLLHWDAVQIKYFTGFRNRWIYGVTEKSDHLSTTSDWSSLSTCSFQEAGESSKERINL